MTDPIPVRGDRSAWDNPGYPGLHAKDLDNSSPLHHLPTASEIGYVPKWDGTKWITGPSGGNQWYQTTIVDAAGNGDYATIKDALDYVATLSWSGIWIVYVLPGEYAEDPFSIPGAVHLVGVVPPAYVGRSAVQVYFEATSGDCITMGSNSAIIGIHIESYATIVGNFAMIYADGSSYHMIRDVAFAYAMYSASNSHEISLIRCDDAYSMLFLFNCEIDDSIEVPEPSTDVCLFRLSNTSQAELKNVMTTINYAETHSSVILKDTAGMELWNAIIGNKFDNRGTGEIRVFGQVAANRYGADPEGSGTGIDDLVFVGETNATLIRGIPVEDAAPADGEILVYDTVSGKFLFAAPGGGAGTFVELTDVPASYTAKAGYFLQVKATEDGIEFTSSSPGTPDAADVTYTPAVAADWNTDTDPGDTDDALDQLAARVTDIEEAGAGGGDMLKSTYDSNNDGKVASADAADAVPWSGVTGKPSMQALFTIEGTLTVGAKAIPLPNYLGRSVTISKVALIVGTAPTGANLIIDLHKDDGLTIFTTQSNRPTIIATNKIGNSTTIEVATWADGSYLTLEIDQVGSTIAGANLSVAIIYS